MDEETEFSLSRSLTGSFILQKKSSTGAGGEKDEGIDRHYFVKAIQ